MKKKIKDLTSEECKKICSNTGWCDKCLLFATHKCVEYGAYLEKEVEVDE